MKIKFFQCNKKKCQEQMNFLRTKKSLCVNLTVNQSLYTRDIHTLYSSKFFSIEQPKLGLLGNISRTEREKEKKTVTGYN